MSAAERGSNLADMSLDLGHPLLVGGVSEMTEITSTFGAAGQEYHYTDAELVVVAQLLPLTHFTPAELQRFYVEFSKIGMGELVDPCRRG